MHRRSRTGTQKLNSLPLLLVERRDQSLLFHIRYLRVLVFGEFLQHFEHAGPASGGLGSKFPAHDSATRYVVVPIRDPGVGEDAGGIVFDDFAVTLKLADVVD